MIFILLVKIIFKIFILVKHVHIVEARSQFSTYIQAGELAALFGVLTKVVTVLRSVAKRGDAHLRLAVVTRAAQAGVVPLGGEVVAFVHHVVLYVHAGLS